MRVRYPDGYRFAIDCRQRAAQPAGRPATTALPYCATELDCGSSGCSGGGLLSCAGAADEADGPSGGDGDSGGGADSGCSGGCGGGD